MGVKASYPKFPKFSNKWMSNILLSFDRSVQLWNGESGMLSRQFLKVGFFVLSTAEVDPCGSALVEIRGTRVACASEDGLGDQDNRS
jgi:hypothetical protein